MAGAKRLMGRTQPRLYTPPLRRLTRKTSRGYEVADFAEHVLGEPLLPWQRWLVVHALELLPDGTYRFRTVIVLVARQNGKTSLARVVSLWRMYLDGARLVLGTAQDVTQARETWSACLDSIREVPDLAAELDNVRRVNGDESFALTNGARYKIRASNRKAGRGLSVDHLNLDELRELRDWLAWGALSKTTMARPHGQTWCTTNAGDDESVVLNHLREAALSGRDQSIGLFEWSAPDGCDLDDPKAIAQANPGLGYTITEQAIHSARATDPPAVYRTEVLCQKVDHLDTAVDISAWKDCKDPGGTLDSARDRVVAVVDVAPDGEHVTLAVAAETGDGRVRGEIVAAWPSTSAARDELDDTLDVVGAQVEAYFASGPAKVLAPIMQRREAHEIKGGDVAAACMGLVDLVAARRILHPGDPLLDAHIAGAQKHGTGDEFRFVRRGVGHVDAAYALAGAVHVALTVPAEKPLPRSAVY